jgi:hypothetical protein
VTHSHRDDQSLDIHDAGEPAQEEAPPQRIPQTNEQLAEAAARQRAMRPEAAPSMSAEPRLTFGGGDDGAPATASRADETAVDLPLARGGISPTAVPAPRTTVTADADSWAAPRADGPAILTSADGDDWIALYEPVAVIPDSDAPGWVGD